MSNKTIDTMRQSPAVLRARVERLEHDVLDLHEQVRRASDEAVRAKKSAETAWSFLRQMRGAPYRG